MSSQENYLEGQVIQQTAVFDIDQEWWDELADNKKAWWKHIQYAWTNVKSKGYKRTEFSSMTNNIYFIFKSKTSVYQNLFLSLKSYDKPHEKIFDKEYYIMIKV